MKDNYMLMRNAFGTEEMRRVWEEENMIQKWLDVEVALTEAQMELGLVPEDIARDIISKCSVKYLTPAMIAEEKAIRGHNNIVAMTKAFVKMCGATGEYFHLGTTTQDIMDTGLVLQIREAYNIVMNKMLQLEDILINIAEKHKNTIMMGRTHAQHALPITFGYKVAVWAGEIDDHIDRFKEMKKRLFQANITGAVGVRNTFVFLAGVEKTNKMQELVAQKLGLNSPIIANHQRTDRFAELVNNLALLISTLGEIGLEIRDLQRTEVREIEEPWDKMMQFSSSTMPNKISPEPSEWMEGLAKIARGNAIAMMDIQMQHERDGTRIAPEFACIPENFLLASAALNTAIRVFGGLVVHEDKMKENLYYDRDIFMAEAIMLKMFQKTKKKNAAHNLIHDLSMRAITEKRNLKDVLLESPDVMKHLTVEEIEKTMNPENYLGTASQQAEEVIKFIRNKRR